MNESPQKDDMREFRALGERYRVLVEETGRSAVLLHEAEQKRKAARDGSERHTAACGKEQRSTFARVGVVVAGGVVSVFAAPLSVVAPELGLPLLLFGLRLLALEFDRAARLYARVKKLARRVEGSFRRLFKSKRRIAVEGVIATVVVAAVAALVL